MTGTRECDGAIRLELLSTPVASGTTVRYALINDGETAILTGTDYALERQTRDGWELVPLNMWFATVGIIIEPGQQRDLCASLPGQVTPGSYRFRKTFRSGPRSGQPRDWQTPAVDVVAELQITAP